MSEKIFRSTTPKSTEKHAQNFAKTLKNGGALILLKGHVGAGKTQWTKGFLSKFLRKSEVITSPSYSVINCYKSGKKLIYHVDLYRLRDIDDLESVGFWELLDSKNLIVVEWGNMVPPQWPKNLSVCEVQFQIIDENIREIQVNWL